MNEVTRNLKKPPAHRPIARPVVLAVANAFATLARFGLLRTVILHGRRRPRPAAQVIEIPRRLP